MESHMDKENFSLKNQKYFIKGPLKMAFSILKPVCMKLKIINIRESSWKAKRMEKGFYKSNRIHLKAKKFRKFNMKSMREFGKMIN